jgi:hypothetical protein
MRHFYGIFSGKKRLPELKATAKIQIIVEITTT